MNNCFKWPIEAKEIYIKKGMQHMPSGIPVVHPAWFSIYPPCAGRNPEKIDTLESVIKCRT